MGKLIEEIIPTLVGWIKAPPRWALFISVIFAAAWYILNPTSKNYVYVPGSKLEVVLPRFHECEISFHEPIEIASYKASEGTDSPVSGISVVGGVTNVTIEQPVKGLRLQYPKPTPLPLPPGLSSPPPVADSSYFLIKSSSAEAFLIDKVEIDSSEIPLQSFLERNLKNKNATYVRFRYIRTLLADVIYNFNDYISNWILTIMCLFTSLLLVDVLLLELRTQLKWQRNKFFAKFLPKPGAASHRQEREKGIEKFVVEWSERDQRFQFLQVLGPAIGFILTVSSLIQALNPKILDGTQADFFGGIHVAMISTFLGLAMRLVALEGARVNNRLGEIFQGLVDCVEA